MTDFDRKEFMRMGTAYMANSIAGRLDAIIQEIAHLRQLQEQGTLFHLMELIDYALTDAHDTLCGIRDNQQGAISDRTLEAIKDDYAKTFKP